MKKRKIICLSVMLIAISTLLLVFSFGVIGRIPSITGEAVWTIQRPGAENLDDVANAIAVYSRGSSTTHVYVAGYLNDHDGWIAKYRDTVGRWPTLLWDKDLSSIFTDWITSKVNDIALTPEGTYLYAVGSYSLTDDLDDQNIFLVILSTIDGSVVSSYTLDVSGFADEPNGVVIVPSSIVPSYVEYVDIYIIGHALNSFNSSEPPFPDGSIFIAKLRKYPLIPELEFKWLVTYDGPATDTSTTYEHAQDRGNDIIYSGGYLYVTGQVNILGLNDLVIAVPWVSKVDPANGELWWQTYDGDRAARGNGITKDSRGFLRICGSRGESVLFLKYSIDGELLSDETGFPSEALSGLPGKARKNVALSRGGVAYTGTIRSGTGNELFVETPFWSDTVNGAGGFYETDYGNAITTNATDEIYVAGSIRSFNPYSSGVMHDDIWIRKYRTLRRSRRD